MRLALGWPWRLPAPTAVQARPATAQASRSRRSRPARAAATALAGGSRQRDPGSRVPGGRTGCPGRSGSDLRPCRSGGRPAPTRGRRGRTAQASMGRSRIGRPQIWSDSFQSVAEAFGQGGRHLARPAQTGVTVTVTVTPARHPGDTRSDTWPRLPLGPRPQVSGTGRLGAPRTELRLRRPRTSRTGPRRLGTGVAARGVTRYRAGQRHQPGSGGNGGSDRRRSAAVTLALPGNGPARW